MQNSVKTADSKLNKKKFEIFPLVSFIQRTEYTYVVYSYGNVQTSIDLKNKN